MDPLERLNHSPRRAAKAAYLLACLWLAACSTTYNPRSYLRGSGELRDTRGIALLFTASCFTQHIVAVDRDGLLLHPGLEPYANAQHWAEYFRVLTNSIATNSLGTNILIFVHGGLNTRVDSFARATNLWWTLQTNQPAYYPIFINWDSGLMSSYWEHLHRVRQGQVVGWTGPATAPFYLLADLGRGITRAPVVFYHNFRSDSMELADATSTLMMTPLTFAAEQTAKTGPVVEASRQAEKPSESFLNRWVPPDSLNAEALYRQLRHRYASNQFHNIAVSAGNVNRSWWKRRARAASYLATLPIKMAGQSLVLDAFGTSAWNNMLRRTRTMFRQPQEFDVAKDRKDEAKLQQHLDAPATGAVAEFMRHLGALTTSTNRSYQITLVGHSMGTIVLSEMIRNYPDLPYTNIVYLAAACSMRDLESSVVPYLAAHPGANFYNVCLHPENDAHGIEVAGDLGPRGTLLQWIDNFFSTPLTMEDRTVGNWYNLMQETHVMPANNRGRVNLKAFSVGHDPGFPEGNPQGHGDFGTNVFWAPAFWSPKPPMRTNAPAARQP